MDGICTPIVLLFCKTVGSSTGLPSIKKNVFYKSEFEKVSEWDTTIQGTMEEYDNVER